jgi:hypothetical protein
MARAEEYREFLNSSVTLHVNPFAGLADAGELGGLFGFRCRRRVSYGGNPSMLLEDIKAMLDAYLRS